MLGQFVDFAFQLHERFTHLLDFLIAERAALHAADGLPLEQLPQKVDQGENQLGEALFDIFRG